MIMAIKILFSFCLFFIIYDLTHCLGSCGDWTAYKTEKCFKVIQKKATEENAITSCSQLDNSSTLISIEDTEEQQFLNTLLEKYNNISENAWIGMKYNDKTYKWLDGSDTNYSNWAEDAVRDGSLQCVEMSLGKSSLGKWTDESCKKSALVVCQKKQLDIDSNDMKKVVQNLIKMVENQQKTIDSQQNEINSIKGGFIPIGFIYTQLPNQSDPIELWANTTWVEITKDYAGLFFRAEGGTSQKFGQIQQANYSKISSIVARGSQMNSWKDDHINGPFEYPLNESKWTDVRPQGLIYWLKFYTTAADNRPVNTAVKIWKRIK